MPDADAKPLLRPRNIILAVLLVLVVWLGSLGIKIATLKPGAAGKFNAALQKSVEDAQADTAGEPNAWPLFRQTVALYDTLADPGKAPAKPADWPQGLAWPPAPEEAEMPEATEAVRAVLRARLKQFVDGGLLTSLDSLAAARRFVRPIGEGRLLDLALPELGSARGIARLCKARMALAAETDDQAEFIRAATHALTLAQAVKRQSTIIDHLVGGAIDSLTSTSIRTALRNRQLTPETCRELLTLLDTRAPRLDIVRGLQGEHLFARDTVEWTHSDDGRGDGYLIPSIAFKAIQPVGGPTSSVPQSLANFATIVAPSKKDTLEAFDRFYTLAESYAATPLRSRAPLQSPDLFVETLSKRMFLVRALSPALGQYIRTADGIEVDVAGTKVMLALELHRAAHGEYPASLDALDAAAAPLRINPQWRSELRYRRNTPGQDPESRPYLLYWIGFDGVDNEGKPLPKTDRWSTLSTGKPGFDFLFTPPRDQEPTPPSPPAGKGPEIQVPPAPPAR